MGLDDSFYVIANEIFNKQSGSKIRFIGLQNSNNDNTANNKGFEGATTLIIEECEEVTSEEMFQITNLSIRSNLRQNRVILVMNPTTKAHWVYKRFFEQNGVNPGYNGIIDDVNYIHTTYLDNIENLDKSAVKELESLKKKDLDYYNRVVMGGWLEKLKGTIYNNWSIGEFPVHEDNIIFGADFGFSNDECTLIGVSIDRKNRKIYLKQYLFESGLSTTQLSRIFLNEAQNRLIVADSSEPRLISELKNNGVNIRPCVKGAGSVKEGIFIIQDYELIVDPSSKDLMTELNNYVWLEKGEMPKDAYNHLLDAMRYAITYYLKGGISGKIYIH